MAAETAVEPGAMGLEVTALGGGSTERIRLSERVFDCPFNAALVHQVIGSRLAAARRGNSAQKSRAQVRGGGRKPWRQKGTGRARVGSTRNPLWRGGGVTFAAQPRDYRQKVNRKMYGGAMRAILSQMLHQGRIEVVSGLSAQVIDPDSQRPRTRLLAALIDARQWRVERLLLVSAEEDAALALAARNLPKVAVCTAAQLCPEALLGCGRALFDPLALAAVEARLQ